MIKTDFVSLARELGPDFAARAADHDANDTFVAENYAALKERGFLSAHVPSELGGGGASHAEMCAVLRELAHHCSSTALAFSMHTHLVAAATWRWNNGDKGGEGLLKRVAAENLVLVSSGGSDWLDSSGSMEKVEGGYRMNGRKVFSSGSPSGDLLVTSAIFDDPADGPTVLHFPVSLRAEGVSILDNWRTMGMRGTGSNDVVIENVFVPDAAIGGKRPVGKWGPFHLVAMVAFPLIYSVYAGVAEAARDIALRQAEKRRDQGETRLNFGEMENELRAAQIAVESMVAIAAAAKPSPDTTNEMMIRRTIAGKAAVRSVEKAMDVAGGGAFFRSLGLERLFRDVQGARYHPLTEKKQLEYTARYTLGLDID
ncbi:MAG TPA: acyl-CoA dehydrogenase family protein [Dehalococcoidia bacterium]|nr:acyl-CoA dehydrogenase family protein [Dehalococcoidia bacterium]